MYMLVLQWRNDKGGMTPVYKQSSGSCSCSSSAFVVVFPRTVCAAADECPSKEEEEWSSATPLKGFPDVLVSAQF